MGIKAVLFDLDGTLLPMDMDKFVKLYFGALVEKFTPCGYEAEDFVNSSWKGINAMRNNDGKVINETVFWNVFYDIYGEEKVRSHQSVFDDFYENDFDKAKGGCGYVPEASEIINFVKSKGLKAVLATNPIFPAVATRRRMSWAGLDHNDFELYTTYENSCFAKPNLDYYREILEKLGLKAEECLMVGNDVSEDMVAEKLGMKVFLLTDCLLNKDNEDISKYPSGSFKELKEYIEKIT
jgi:HAD superfamily hydrolase (TIGR01549 family)